MQQEVSTRQNVIDSLRTIIGNDRLAASAGVQLVPEVKVLFPTIEDLAVSKVVASSVSSSSTDTLNMIFVNAPKGLTPVERNKLKEYVGVRLNEHNIHLTVNPSGFPWPSSASEKVRKR